MAEGIAVLTAEGKVLFTNRAMEGHLNLHSGQALTVRGLMDEADAIDSQRLLEATASEPGPPPTSREGSNPPSGAPGPSEPPPSSQQSGRSTLERIEHELLRRSLGRERTEICLDRSDRSLVVAASPVLD